MMALLVFAKSEKKTFDKPPSNPITRVSLKIFWFIKVDQTKVYNYTYQISRENK